MYTAFEMWSAITTEYYTENRPILYTNTTDSSKTAQKITHQVGLPAELIQNSTVDLNHLIERYDEGRLRDLFVHAGDLVSLTGCSAETGRSWLQKFHDHDLLHLHGEGDVPIDEDDQLVNLYLPKVNDKEKTMRVIYELEGRVYPDSVEDFEHVTPSQFSHLDGSKFVLNDDPEVTVDVDPPEDQRITIQDYIDEQLRPHGYKPSSPRNFSNTLRNKANII